MRLGLGSQLAATVCLMAVFACGGASSGVDGAKTPFALSGRVTSNGNGTPVAGAFLMLRRMSGYPPSDVFVASATSDSAGWYELDARYDALGSCQGYRLAVDAKMYFLEYAYPREIDCSHNQPYDIALEPEPATLEIEPPSDTLKAGESATLTVYASYPDGRTHERPLPYGRYWKPVWEALGDTPCGHIAGPSAGPTLTFVGESEAPVTGECSAQSPGYVPIVVRPWTTCLFCLRTGDLTAVDTAAVVLVLTQ